MRERLSLWTALMKYGFGDNISFDVIIIWALRVDKVQLWSLSEIVNVTDNYQLSKKIKKWCFFFQEGQNINKKEVQEEVITEVSWRYNIWDNAIVSSATNNYHQGCKP